MPNVEFSLIVNTGYKLY